MDFLPWSVIFSSFFRVIPRSPDHRSYQHAIAPALSRANIILFHNVAILKNALKYLYISKAKNIAGLGEPCHAGIRLLELSHFGKDEDKGLESLEL